LIRQEAAGLRQQATRDADDSRALWENEIKSRSKLGLRVSPQQCSQITANGNLLDAFDSF